MWRWFITTLAILLGGWILPGVHTAGFFASIWTAAIFGVVMYFVGNVLKIFTLPFAFITFGISFWIINSLMLVLTAWIVGDYYSLDNFWWAFLHSGIITIAREVFASED